MTSQRQIANAKVAELMPIVKKQTAIVAQQSRVPYDELLSEAMYGLAKAMGAGDWDRPGFYNYVKLYVRGHLFNYLRDNSRVVKLPRSLSLIYLAEQRLAKTDSRAWANMTDTERADKIGCTLAELLEARSAVSFGHQTLDYHDATEGLLAVESEAEDYDLLQYVIQLGINQVATQTRQDVVTVRTAVYESLQKLIGELNDRF